MSAVPEPVAERGPATVQGAWLRHLPAVLLLLTVVCGVIACFQYPINHDASYLLYVAGRVLQGAVLYVDLPEINPPLIVWAQLPLAWFAQQGGLPGPLVLRIALLLLALFSVTWSSILLRAFLPRGAWWSWLAAAAYVALIVPGYDFGEREHIVVLCILPYMAEACRRSSGDAAVRPAQVTAALLAIVGLALKPHFLLVPILVEGYIALRWRRLGAGCVAAALLLAAYLAALALFAPEYFAMVRMLASGYWGYSKGYWIFLLVPAFYVTVIFVAMAWLVRPRMDPVTMVLTLAIAGFVIAAVVQQKGWSYHWIPALSLAWLLFGLTVARVTHARSIAGMPFISLGASAVVTLLALLALSSAKQDGLRSNPWPSELGPVIHELGGGPVIIASSAFRTSYPLVTEAGIGTSTRFPAMTIVTSMERGGNPEAIKWIRRSVAEDFYRKPPRLLLLETDEQGRPVFDFVQYFRPDVPELQQYRLVRRLPRFQVLAAPDGLRR